MAINNPYYCLGCNHTYNEKEGDIDSNVMADYVRFLGYCGDGCFSDLPHDLQQNNMNFAYERGDILKRRHQFYHKNIPDFRRYNKPIKKRKLS
jgi:rubredoxin